MKKIKFNELNIQPYTAIAKDWMLVSAGNSKDHYNTMTASWGHLGSIWGHGGGRQTAICYIRPSRYTKEFVDKEEYFSLSFFNAEYKNDLAYLGAHSGKDEDKVAKTKLTPLFDNKAVYFQEAKITLICRKLYVQEMKAECFYDKSIIDDNYPLRDFHTLYIGEIEEVLINE